MKFELKPLTYESFKDAPPVHQGVCHMEAARAPDESPRLILARFGITEDNYNRIISYPPNQLHIEALRAHAEAERDALLSEQASNLRKAVEVQGRVLEELLSGQRLTTAHASIVRDVIRQDPHRTLVPSTKVDVASRQGVSTKHIEAIEERMRLEQGAPEEED